MVLGLAALGVATLVGRSPADAQSAGALVRLPYCSAWPDRVSVELSAKGMEDVGASVPRRVVDQELACRYESRPMPADFDGDGLADRSVWLPESGAWYVEGAETEYLGLPSDIPVPGDYDGDGAAERAVFRDGAWFVAGSPTRYLGAAGDTPVPGDYDGDGSWDPAVFRDGAWYIDGSATAFLGVAGDCPGAG